MILIKKHNCNIIFLSCYCFVSTFPPVAAANWASEEYLGRKFIPFFSARRRRRSTCRLSHNLLILVFVTQWFVVRTTLICIYKNTNQKPARDIRIQLRYNSVCSSCMALECGWHSNGNVFVRSDKNYNSFCSSRETTTTTTNCCDNVSWLGHYQPAKWSLNYPSSPYR